MGKMNEFTILIRDFNNPFSTTTRKKHNYLEELSNTIK